MSFLLAPCSVIPSAEAIEHSNACSFERARPLLDKMGSRAIYCGGNGTGLAAKICNNLLLGIQMAGTACVSPCALHTLRAS